MNFIEEAINVYRTNKHIVVQKIGCGSANFAAAAFFAPPFGRGNFRFCRGFPGIFPIFQTVKEKQS